MGEIADAILNGDFDEITGEWLGPGQGFPRSLHYKNNRHHSPPKNSAVHGVKCYLKQMGYKKAEHHSIVSEYTGEKDLVKGCEAIQKDFGKFVNFVKHIKALP